MNSQLIWNFKGSSTSIDSTEKRSFDIKNPISLVEKLVSILARNRVFSVDSSIS